MHTIKAIRQPAWPFQLATQLLPTITTNQVITIAIITITNTITIPTPHPPLPHALTDEPLDAEALEMAVVGRPTRAVVEAGQVGARRRGALAHVFGADHVGGSGPHQVEGTPVYPD